MKIKNLFSNFNSAVAKYAESRKEMETVTKSIVKELQQEVGYVEFTIDTGYPHFDDDTIGSDTIIAVKYDEKDDELLLITESQGVRPCEEDSEGEWFSWYMYGNLDFGDLVYSLHQFAIENQ